MSSFVYLRCRAGDAGKHYLAGDAPGGTGVSLRNKQEPGTIWVMSEYNLTGIFNLMCAQDASIFDIGLSPDEPRYLDGNTVTGSVQLSLHTEPPFTGARWLVTDGPDGSSLFRCQGVEEGAGARLLDGWPGPNTVQLRPDTSFAGTHWEIGSAEV